LQLEPKDALVFPKLVALGCGKLATVASFSELLEVGRLADCYGVTSVCEAVEWEATRQLSIERAAEVLAGETTLGMVRLQDASRELALRRFEAFARTAAFVRLGEEELGSLLDADGLEAGAEERVLVAAARWMRAGAPGRGEGLLRQIRFGAMATEYLSGPAQSVLPRSNAAERLFAAELKRRAERAAAGGDSEGEAERRRGRVAIGWRRHADGYESVFQAHPYHTCTAVAVCHCRQRHLVCLGTLLGAIIVTERKGQGLKQVRLWEKSATSTITGESATITGLAAWMGLLASGDESGLLSLWDLGAGKLVQVARAHLDSVTALAVCGGGAWLVSGSADTKAAAWVAGPCGRFLERARVREMGAAVRCLAALGGARVAVGCPYAVAIWDVGRDTVDRTLDVCCPRPHNRAYVSSSEGLQALAADGGRLAGTNGRAVEVWGWERGVRLAAAEAYQAWSAQRVKSMAMHGGQLVTGSGGEKGTGCEARVWDLDTLQVEHVLPQARSPGRDGFAAMVAGRGCVYGAIGSRTVVWGLDSEAVEACDGGAESAGGGGPDPGGPWLWARGAVRSSLLRLRAAFARCLG
jgi:hypothetical protein